LGLLGEEEGRWSGPRRAFGDEGEAMAETVRQGQRALEQVEEGGAVGGVVGLVWCHEDVVDDEEGDREGGEVLERDILRIFCRERQWT
jgi:hypothetical protein